MFWRTSRSSLTALLEWWIAVVPCQRKWPLEQLCWKPSYCWDTASLECRQRERLAANWPVEVEPRHLGWYRHSIGWNRGYEQSHVVLVLQRSFDAAIQRGSDNYTVWQLCGYPSHSVSHSSMLWMLDVPFVPGLHRPTQCLRAVLALLYFFLGLWGISHCLEDMWLNASSSHFRPGYWLRWRKMLNQNHRRASWI